MAELVVPGQELDDAVGDLAAALLVTDAAASRATKELLALAAGNSLEEQAKAERSAQRKLLSAKLPSATLPSA
jgi:hypothetical protein